MQELVVFDLDGTLADIEHRRHFVSDGNKQWDKFFEACVDDVPINPIIDILHGLHHQDHDIQIWSGRSEDVRPQTEVWLMNKAGVYTQSTQGLWAFKNTTHDPSDILIEKLRMRPSGDYIPDEQLKEQWLQEEADRGRKVSLVFDDRDKVVKMWRDHGIRCCQVAPGDF